MKVIRVFVTAEKPATTINLLLMSHKIINKNVVNLSSNTFSFLDYMLVYPFFCYPPYIFFSFTLRMGKNVHHTGRPATII